MVLDERGPLHDRRWMLIDALDRTFVTQRELPALATIDTAIDGQSVMVSAAGHPALPLTPADAQGAARTIDVWGHPRTGRDAGDATAQWFSSVVGHSVRMLVDTDEGTLAFADAYPLLVTSQSSLEDLNRRLRTAVPMDRFRPNAVIEGPPAWDEDTWAALQIGATRLEIAKPCARCVVINTDQATGARDPEPLRELAKFRLLRGDGAMFGVNAVHDGPGTLRVGAPVTIHPRSELRP